MKIKVIDLSNKKIGDIDLSGDIFGLPIRIDILHRVVEWQRAKSRSGTHKAKTISEISGTTKKPFKQKGTGNARQGSLRSAQFRGGACIFGPVVRSHEHSLPKKVRKLGLKTALSSKLSEGKLIVIKEANLDQPKTKMLKEIFSNMGIKSALIIDGNSVNDNFSKAAANIHGIDVLPQQGANVYDILRHENLILTETAVAELEKRLLND